MRLGFSLGSIHPDRDADLLVPLARAAERLGFDSVWLPDHVLRTFERRLFDPCRRWRRWPAPPSASGWAPAC